MLLHRVHRASPWLGLAVALWLALAPSLTVAAAPVQQAGSYYVVQPGDSWAAIAWRSGLTIGQLRAANPALIRPGDVLWPGDRLFIPAPGAGGALAPQAAAATPAGPGYWYTLKAGDTWQSMARDTGVDILNLYHANPALVARNRNLYPGEKVWIPGAQPVAPEATPTPTPTPLPPPAPEPPPPPTVAPAPSAAGPGCPAQFSAYPAAIAGYLNGPAASAVGLRAWLTRCGAINQLLGVVAEGHIQRQDTNDVVVVLYDPSDRRLVPAARLLVYHDSPAGYTLAGVAQGDGRIAVLKVADVNADGLTDVVWTDTTCDTVACYSTLFVDSWDGTAYRSYIDDQPTTANAEYTFQAVPGSQAQAIVVRSRGAAPAQDQAVTYLSTAGGPYRPEGQARTGLASSVAVTATATAPVAAPTAVPPPATPGALPTMAPVTSTAAPPTMAPVATPAPTNTSAARAAPQPAATAASTGCLYDRVRLANQAFDAWTTQGFADAIDAYRAIIADTTSKACGKSPDELALLRDFARFRLMVALIGSGQGGSAPAQRDQMTMPALRGAADTFLNSHRDSRSVIQACRDVTSYAGSHPDAWQFLVDLGSKDFTAADLCPLAK